MSKKWLLAILVSIPAVILFVLTIEGRFDPELGLMSEEDPRRPTPVLVELFTSEGCSSCPPADALLMKLDGEQPVPAAEIITLGEHVDYWDRLGWPDRFSSPVFSQRQLDYAQALQTNAYTPQMVVDGRVEFVGSDAHFAQAAIESASREKKALLDIQVLPTSRGNSEVVRLEAHLSSPISSNSSEGADVFLAITETNLTTEVQAGENAGRVMNHTSVVRNLRRISKLDSRQEFATEVTIPQDWDRSNLRAVIFVQEQRSRHILAVGQVSLAAE